MTERPLPEGIAAADHGRALLGLQLSEGEAVQGPPPSTEELALLSTGQLKQQLGHRRHEQVLSHINADADLLARWLQVSEAQHAAAPAKSKGKTRRLAGLLSALWAHRLPAAAAVACTALLAVAVMLQTGRDGIGPSTAHQPPVYTSAGDKIVADNVTRGALAALRQLPEDRQQLLLSEANIIPAARPAAETEHALAYQYGEQLTRAWQQCAQDGGSLTADSHGRLQQLQDALGLSRAPADCAAVRQQWRQAVR